MKHNPFWDKVFSTSSWILVGVLVYASLYVVIVPIGVNGPVAQLVGPTAAEWFYFVLYLGHALALAYSKWKKKKKMRKHVLLSIYLVGLFTGILSISIAGFNLLAQWDNLATAVIAAGCWLYWTFKTEYLDPSYFYEETYYLRDDMPDKR